MLRDFNRAREPPGRQRTRVYGSFHAAHEAAALRLNTRAANTQEQQKNKNKTMGGGVAPGLSAETDNTGFQFNRTAATKGLPQAFLP